MPLPRRPYAMSRTHEVFEIAHALAARLGHDDARAEVLRVYGASPDP